MWDQSSVDGPFEVYRTVGATFGTAPFGVAPFGGGPQEIVPGYHVNLVPSFVTAAIEPYRVHPLTPSRIFAGDAEPWAMTAFFRFESEWQARALMPQLWRDSFAPFEERLTFGPPLFGTEREQQFRAEVLQRLDNLQAAIAAGTERPVPGLGHNNPPDNPADVVAQATAATVELRSELEAPAPNMAEVATRARLIDRLGLVIEYVRQEPSKIAHVALDNWREALVLGVPSLIVSKWDRIQQSISSLLDALLRWINVLF